MEHDEAAESLRALATASLNRSKMGRIRMLYPEIMNARKAGVSLETMLETLNEQGLELTLLTFKTLLYRVRKELKQNGETIPAAMPPVILTPKREDSKTQANEPAPSNEQARNEIEDEGGAQIRLSAKQRREKLADQYIKPELTNPLLRKFNKETK